VETTDRLEQEAQDALRHLRQGDPQGLARLVDLLGPRLLSFLQRLLGQASDAEDALQETFATLCTKAGQQNPEVGSVTGWIYRIARNQGLQMLRRRQAEARARAAPPPPAAPTDPEQIVERHFQLDEIDRALQAIPIDLRVPFLMRECLDLPYAQIAHLTDRSVNQVASDILRARQLLREYVRS
jgi:RNA polymerase sigma-70 factor (ECF subfamily)